MKLLSIKFIIIAVAVVAGLAGIILARMNVVKEVVYEENDRFESFDKFAARQGFRIMSDEEKQAFRKTIYAYTRTGFIADIFKSIEPTDKYAEKTGGDPKEYLLHHFAVHQSGGYFRHVYGVFLQSERFDFPEILMTPSGYFSNLMKMVRKGDRWTSHDSIPRYDCFSKSERMDPATVSTFAPVLNGQPEPLLSIHARGNGFLVFFMHRNKVVEDDFDYAHLHEAAHTIAGLVR
jgi:hypothetical protein